MKKAFLALATAMCLPAMAVNASNITPYVVGGDPVTDISTQSWMASLRIVSMDNAHNCGASVIADNWLVTAAHCVVTPGSNGKYMVIPPQHLNVAVGSATIDLSDVAHLYSVSHVVVHPDYMPDGDFEQDYNGDIIVNKTGLYSDIALLRVHRSFPADSVTPITLASPEIANEIDTRLAAEWDAANRVKNTSVSGWGAVDPGASEAPNTLQQAELTFLPIADCFQLIEQGNSIHGIIESPFDLTKICSISPEIRDDITIVEPDPELDEDGNPVEQDPVYTGDYGADSCKGDSGGPLRAQDANGNWVQIGIVSGGVVGTPTCGSVSRPSFYTRVGTYYDWVQKSIANVPGSAVVEPDFIADDRTDMCNPNSSGVSHTNCDFRENSSSGGTIGAGLLSLFALGWLRRKQK
ncbi:trypsin-like serine protease [Photobacterium aphoticum]|uniref:S1 family peptidase n=1 Tax=Photobacterium aphoticum TaxID=754436 RepID=UPI00069F16C2|nr:serine protease [Photobacterium aphoticum]PSU59460.1 serine protease [Photobacterium aphoticum]GHA40491.1 serine protease [Photobacterium aphoticum]